MLVSNRRFDLPGEHIDVALRAARAGHGPQWVTRPLARLRKLVVAAPAYLEARGRPQRLRTCSATTHSVWANRTVCRRQFHPVAADREAHWPPCVDVQPRLLCSEFQVLLQSALAGRGIVGLPRQCVVRRSATAGSKVVLPQMAGHGGRDAIWSIPRGAACFRRCAS